MFHSSSHNCCCRIQTPIVISWRRYRSEIFASSLNLLHASAQKKQVEVLSSSSLTSGSRTSHSLSLALTLDYLCFLAISVSFVCLSLPMPKSKGCLKLFSFHIASLWCTTFDFGHSNHVLMSRVFSCWFFAYSKLKEELCCPWSSKSNRLLLIRIHPKWTPRKNKHWFVNCLLLLLRDYSILAFIFMWQQRCTLNTCLKL